MPVKLPLTTTKWTPLLCVGLKHQNKTTGKRKQSKKIWELLSRLHREPQIKQETRTRGQTPNYITATTVKSIWYKVENWFSMLSFLQASLQEATVLSVYSSYTAASSHGSSMRTCHTYASEPHPHFPVVAVSLFALLSTGSRIKSSSSLTPI